MGPKFKKWARTRTREYYINARRGIRKSGLLIIGFGFAAIAVLHLGLPNIVQGSAAVGFIYASISHLVGISQVDRGGPTPECPTCRIQLITHKYRCAGCSRQYPTS